MSELGKNVARKLLLEIRREDMPQISGDDIDEALSVLEEYGVKYTTEAVRINSLKPLQENYIPAKVDKFVKMFTKEGKECYPLFVSEDNYILDGHHRWLAKAKIESADGIIDIIRIHEPKTEALKMFYRASKEVSETIVVYPGRFQPFTKSHYKVYFHLCEKFGKNNVYIVTSNKTNRLQSPFSFAEKKYMMTEGYGIPEDRIVKNPGYGGYEFKYFTETFPEDPSLVVGLGSKDADRLNTNTGYYRKYEEGKDLEPSSQRGYCYAVPSPEVNASDVRKTLKSNKHAFGEKRQYFFENCTSSETVFNMVYSKLLVDSALIQEFVKERSIPDMINEVTQAISAGVDDGPSMFYKNVAEFKASSDNIAEQFGYRVVSYLTGPREDYDDHEYRYDIVPVVSFGESGVRAPSPNAEQRWHEYARRITHKIGMEVIDYLGAKFDAGEGNDDVEVSDDIKK